MNIQEYLREHPLPWKHERHGKGLCASVIRDSGAIAKDIPVASDLCPEFAELVISLVNSYLSQADTIARKDALLGEAAAKIEELRKERDTAIAQRDAAIAESDDNRTRLLDERVLAAGHSRALNSANVEIEQLKARLAEVSAERETAIDDAAELHALFSTQRELIERLQNRIKRMEARA